MTAFEHAERYRGEIKEIPGSGHHPLIQWWHSLCAQGFDAADEIPWCSSFVNGIAWDLRLPRSKSAAARSWLHVGEAVDLPHATAAYCVVVLKRGASPTAGHVGFYAGQDDAGDLRLLGGNQSNQVTIGTFPIEDLLGIRRLK